MTLLKKSVRTAAGLAVAADSVIAAKEIMQVFVKRIGLLRFFVPAASHSQGKQVAYQSAFASRWPYRGAETAAPAKMLTRLGRTFAG